MKGILALCAWCGVSAAWAADFPQAEISNRFIQAKLYLPDPDRGYYRGTRFDWSGVIASLQCEGHNYFGKWFERYDPKIHDAISGPVEEFRSEDGALGYDEAQPPRGLFVKIGVGVLRKPDDEKYVFARTYDLLSSGKWITRPEPDRVEFEQDLNDGSGYAYVYRKTVRVVGNKPELVIEHSLKNTGQKVIDTSVYNHDFYMLDGQPTGQDFDVKFAFKPQLSATFKGPVEVNGNTLDYKRELEKGESAAGDIAGFSDKVVDNDIRVEDRKTGAGVRETGDHPLSRLYFWSIRTTVCPEAYIHMHIEPKREFKWRIAYTFYRVNGASSGEQTGTTRVKALRKTAR